MDTVAIAKRFIRDNQAVVDAIEREYDSQWEIIRFMDDPTLEPETIKDVLKRGLSIPKRWITVGVVKPYVIDGITKSLSRG